MDCGLVHSHLQKGGRKQQKGSARFQTNKFELLFEKGYIVSQWGLKTYNEKQLKKHPSPRGGGELLTERGLERCILPVGGCLVKKCLFGLPAIKNSFGKVSQRRGFNVPGGGRAKAGDAATPWK